MIWYNIWYETNIIQIIQRNILGKFLFVLVNKYLKLLINKLPIACTRYNWWIGLLITCEYLTWLKELIYVQ